MSTDAGADGGESNIPIEPDAPILVIGAGLSGLAAATQLAARGFTNVRVIEARDRTCGRIYTDRSTGHAFDLGAAWVQYSTDPTNPLLGMLKQLGVDPPVTNWDSLTVYDETSGAISTSKLTSGETTFENDLTTIGNTFAGLANKNVSLGQVATMFGATSPAPKAVIRTNWTADPYSLGAYTYPGIAPVQTAIAALAAPVGGRVFFAGEATDPDWYSYTQGAYLSGIRAANEL